MSSLADSTDTITVDPSVPTDEAGQPLIWDGNPARVLGLLHECSEYFLRMGQHQPAITMRAALLSNGRLAVESVSVPLERVHEVHAFESGKISGSVMTKVLY